MQFFDEQLHPDDLRVDESSFRRRKSGKPDLIETTFELLEKATPLFSGAR